MTVIERMIATKLKMVYEINKLSSQ